jgi:hypothetical protein
MNKQFKNKKIDDNKNNCNLKKNKNLEKKKLKKIDKYK